MKENNKSSQEVIDNNRLIAIFMNNYQKLSQDPEFGKFHLQWDWLMPVVKKIRDVINVELYSDDYFNIADLTKRMNSYDYDLNQVYEAVVEFIKWYNKNKEDNDMDTRIST